MAKKYYKKIKNQNYDRELLNIADAAIAGRGDGQISLDDAEKILWAVKDNGEYTDIEKKTIHYIRDNYKFTKKADAWFRKEIRSWAASKKNSSKKGKPAKNTPKPVEEEPEIEFSPEPDPSYYQIQKPFPKKEDSSKTNKMMILTSVSILALFILAYFLFSAFQNWRKNRKMESPQKVETTVKPIPEIEKIAPSPTPPTEQNPNNSLQVEPEKSESGLTKDIILSESLLFDDSELYVNKKNRSFLRKMAQFLKENPELKVKVIGHTCNRGTDEDNQKLSLERAESVIKYLKLQGVEIARLTPIGEGKKKPIAENSTREGKIRNRRVQFDFF